MAAMKGKDLILKIGTAAAGTPVAALRPTTLRLNNQMVDVTTKDSNGFRELLAAAGIKSLTITAGFVVTDSSQMATLADRCLAQSIDAYGIVFGNALKLDGSFQLTQFEITGQHDDAQSGTLTLESSGTVTRS